MKIISILINSFHLHRTSKLHGRGTDLHNDEYDRHYGVQTTPYRSGFDSISVMIFSAPFCDTPFQLSFKGLLALLK